MRRVPGMMASAFASLAALVLVIGSGAERARAADLGVTDEGIVEGVPCESPEAKAFPSVWLGHFSGGYSHYLGPGQSIVLDWRDEKLCFPSRYSCGRYITAMRRDFHRPEGYFTCLPIR